MQHSDVRTQERGIVLRESTQGESYNTHKYLQENTLHPHARQEPYGLVSKNNCDLKKVSNLENASGPLQYGSVVQYTADEKASSLQKHSSSAVEDPFNNYPVNIRPQPRMPRSKTSSHPLISTGRSMNGGVLQKSQSSNFLPSNLRHSWSYQSSYQDQHTGDDPIDMTYKQDPRFKWQLGCGTPRPQTSLLKLQDAFNKSEVKRKFYQRFGDNAPDLRENLVMGKKHSFGGMNAQIMRGTPVIEC